MYPVVQLPWWNLSLPSSRIAQIAGILCFAIVFVRLVWHEPRRHALTFLLTLLVVFGHAWLNHVVLVLVREGMPGLASLGGWMPFTGPYAAGSVICWVLLVAYFGAMRLAQWPFLDAVCIAWSAAYMIFKTGCLLNGCCGGRAITATWGQWLGGVHPSPPYDIIWQAITIVALLWLFRQGAMRGQLILVLGFLHAGGRGVLDRFRDERLFVMSEPPTSLVQLVCVALVAFSATALFSELLGRRRGQSAPAPAQT